MSTICIIPARGGSKRIPRKNIRPLLGRPIMAWVIEAAQRSAVFDEVMVSTEDADIAAVAKAAGANIPFLRSRDTAGDFASTAEVIREVLLAYANRGQCFDVVCCLYPTAVLVNKDLLQRSRELLNDSTVDTSMSVQAYRHPIERALCLRDGILEPVSPASQGLRTQDLPTTYHDAGQFYFFRASGLLARGTMVGPRCVPVVLGPGDAVDLDQESDWALLEQLTAARMGCVA